MSSSVNKPCRAQAGSRSPLIGVAVAALALLVASCTTQTGTTEPDEGPADSNETSADQVEDTEAQPEDTEAQPEDDEPADLVEVNFQLDFLYAGYQAPFFYALEQGLWEERGLDVTVREGNGSANGIQTIVGGVNHLGLFDRPTMAVSRESHADLISVLGIDNRGGWAVATPAELGIQSPEDLVGTTIATQLGGADGTILPAFLEANGLSDSDLTIESVDPAAKTTLLQSGRVDGATYINYAQVPQIEASGVDLNTMLWSDHGLPLVGAGLVASRSWAEDNPEIVSAFIGGLSQALEASTTDPEAVVDAFELHVSEFDREVALAQLELVIEALQGLGTEGQPLGWQSEESWGATISTLETVGMLSEASDIEDYFDNSYLLEASS